MDPTSPYSVWHLKGLDSAGATEDVLLTSGVLFNSATADTPADISAYPTLRPSREPRWVAVKTDKDKAASFIDAAGVVSYGNGRGIIRGTADNAPRNPSTKKAPLDPLADLDFRGQDAVLWACYPSFDGQRWRPSALGAAKNKKVALGTILEAGFPSGRDAFQFSIEEHTSAGLRDPATPLQYPGFPRAVVIEDGGAVITRADTATLYDSTKSQWFAFIFTITGDDSTSTDYGLLASPILRIRRVGSATNVIKVQMLNSAAGWQDIGTNVSFTAGVDNGGLLTLLVNYDVSTTTATLYSGGVSQGSTVLTGGLYASGSGTLTMFNTPTVGTCEAAWMGVRHGQRLLAADEIRQRSMFGWDSAGESNLTLDLRFDNGFLTTIVDYGDGVDAHMSGFADSDAAWVETGLGERSSAFARPAALVGLPFEAPAETVGALGLLMTPGYTGLNPGLRYVAANGGRLTRAGSGATVTTAFTAPDRVETWPAPSTPFIFSPEPPTGAVFNVGSGANAGDKTVRVVQRTPRHPESGAFSVLVEEAITTAGAASIAFTQVSESDWEEVVDTDIGIVIDNDFSDYGGGTNLPRFQLLRAGLERLTASFRRVDVVISPAAAFLKRLGPLESSVTETNTSSTLVDSDYGWRGEGETLSLDAVDELARTSSSADDSSSVVYRGSDGTYVVRGFDRSPSSADYTWDETSLASVEEVPLAQRFKSIIVRYGRAWQVTQADRQPGAAAVDAFGAAAAVPWATVQSGTASPVKIVDRYYLGASEAQPHADALLDIQQNGRLFDAVLAAPPSPTELAMTPLQVADITWPNTLLESGLNGSIVGAAWKPEGFTVRVLFIE